MADTVQSLAKKRTVAEFIDHHLRELKITNDNCSICRNPYGTLDPGFGTRDIPKQIVGLRTCSHIFGSACLYRLIFTWKEGWTCCPLCATEWYWTPPAGTETAKERHDAAFNWKCIMPADYATCRYILFKEPEYEGRYIPMALHWLQDHMRFSSVIERAFKEPAIDTILDRLSLQCRRSFTKVDTDRLAENIIYRYASPDLFRFGNWQTVTPLIGETVTLALLSLKGEGLKGLYEQRVFINREELTSKTKSKDQLIAQVSEMWRDSAWYDHEDDPDFVYLLVNVIYVVEPPESILA